MFESTLLPNVSAFLAKPAKMLIGGKWLDATAGGWIDSLDPATGRAIGKFADGAEADANLAVAAARDALPAWRRVSPYDRGRLLSKAAALIESHAAELAELIVLENGKPLWEAKKEAATAVSWTEYYAGWATKLTGETIPVSLPGQYLNYTIREPLGVVVGYYSAQFPVDHALVQIGTGARDGQHCHHQALRRHDAGGIAGCGIVPGSRISAGRGQTWSPASARPSALH